MKKEKNKQRTRRLSIRLKLLIPSATLIILLCVIMGLNSYIRMKDSVVSLGVEQARMAASITEESIDGNQIASLRPGSETTTEYLDTLSTLKSLKKSCGIAYLYTLYTDGKKVYYGVDSSATRKTSYMGEKFESSYNELKSVFSGKEYVQDYIDSTEDGDLITVYKPIKTTDGKIIGVLGCDFDASNVLDSLNTAKQRVLEISVLCLIVSMFLLNLIISLITRRLHIVNSKVHELAANEGDLTQKLQIHSGDELELIAGNINDLLTYIQKIMLNISHNSKLLSESSVQITQKTANSEEDITGVSATMEELSAAMQETSASLTQITSAIQDIYQECEQIAQKAQTGQATSLEMSDRSDKIRQSAINSQQQMQEKTASISNILNEKIELARAVENISVLTENIMNITDQTTLLALNASIEAARAGEAGKGFAVVADEIGKLADSSTEAAKQIQEVSQTVIDAVNGLAKESEHMMEFADTTALDGYKQLVELSETYNQDAQNTLQAMQDFASSSTHLQNTLDDIKDSISSVDIAVNEGTKGITDVSETAVNLSENMNLLNEEAQKESGIASKLNAEVNRFKLQ